MRRGDGPSLGGGHILRRRYVVSLPSISRLGFRWGIQIERVWLLLEAFPLEGIRQRDALLSRCRHFYLRQRSCPEKNIIKMGAFAAHSTLIAAAFSREFQVGLSGGGERREACS